MNVCEVNVTQKWRGWNLIFFSRTGFSLSGFVKP
jgi:hypothetical protein